MKPRVLVAAGDASLRAQIARWLMAAGYAVELAESPKRMREVLAQEDIALAILVPDRMGNLEIAQELGHEVNRLILVTGSENRTDSVPNVAARLSQPLSEGELIACVKDALPAS